MIGTLYWSDCVHLSEVAWELAAFVLAPPVHSTSRPVSPDQGLINTISLSPEVTDLPTRYPVRGRRGHRIAIIRRAGEGDGGDRDCVLGVRAYGLRGENRDYVPATQKAGGRCFSPSMQPARYTNEQSSFVYLGGAIIADIYLSIEITQRLQRAWTCF